MLANSLCVELHQSPNIVALELSAYRIIFPPKVGPIHPTWRRCNYDQFNDIVSPTARYFL